MSNAIPRPATRLGRSFVGTLLERVVPWRMRRISFAGQADAAARACSTEIREVFLRGARLSFAECAASEVRASELDVPWGRRPFFWEGHAFGAAARHACGLARGNPSARYHAPGFRFMFFTGVGFWNGTAARHLLPSVSLDRGFWADVEDFAGSLPLVAGGVSFATIGLLGRFDRSALARLSSGDASWRRGVFQGAGRAAWFLTMGDMQRTGALLQDLGADAEAVAEGIGLAITYTQLEKPGEIRRQIDELPAGFRRAARGGSRLCLAAAASDDARVADRMVRLPDPLDRWYREGAAALEDAGRGPDMPERLTAALRDLD